jgi:hypothetical protein
MLKHRKRRANLYDQNVSYKSPVLYTRIFSLSIQVKGQRRYYNEDYGWEHKMTAFDVSGNMRKSLLQYQVSANNV